MAGPANSRFHRKGLPGPASETSTVRRNTRPVVIFRRSPPLHPDRDPLPLVGQDQRGGPILQADARLPEGLQHLGDYLPEVHGAAWGWGVPISSNSSRMTTRSSKGRFSPWISW